MPYGQPSRAEHFIVTAQYSWHTSQLKCLYQPLEITFYDFVQNKRKLCQHALCIQRWISVKIWLEIYNIDLNIQINTKP